MDDNPPVDQPVGLGVNATEPTSEQWKAFADIAHEGPVVMANLIKLKPGGEDAFSTYSAAVSRLLEEIGARVIFVGRGAVCFVGNADWDLVALVEYPNKHALIEMVRSEEYQAIHHHREAGLAGQVNYAVIQV